MSIFFVLIFPQNHLEGYNVFRYTPTKEVHERYKDGGVAIIDQIIASHARYVSHDNAVLQWFSTSDYDIFEGRKISEKIHQTWIKLAQDKLFSRFF